MSRPKPEVLVEITNKETYKTEQVLASDGIWAVYFEDRPINLKTSNYLVQYPGPKYKKVSEIMLNVSTEFIFNTSLAFILAVLIVVIFAVVIFAVVICPVVDLQYISKWEERLAVAELRLVI